VNEVIDTKKSIGREFNFMIVNFRFEKLHFIVVQAVPSLSSLVNIPDKINT
jgi:hypothetical protein